MIDALMKLIELLASWWHALTPWAILPEEEVGFIRLFGRFQKTMRPGLNRKWPIVAKAETISAQEAVYMLDPQSLRTADGVELVIRASVTFRVVNARRFHLEAWGALGNIRDLVAGEIGETVRKSQAEEVFSGLAVKRALASAREQSTKWGIKIVRIRCSDLSKTRSLRLWQTQTTAAGEE